MRAAGCALCLALLLFPAASPLRAQQVTVAGRGDPRWDSRLREIVESGSYTTFTHDTLIARGDTIRGPVLAPGITLRLEGVIDGDLVGVDANLFLRPHARVTGNVVNIAGGFYPSELASVDGNVTDQPNAPYDVERRGDQLRIVGTRARSLLQLEGFRGLQPPAYDRVDGVRLRLGARYLTPRVGYTEPFIGGRVTYHSQRGDFGGMAEIGLRRGGTELAFGAERHTVTNDAWIRGELSNSASFVWQGKDYRNYHEADRFYAELRRTLQSGARSTSVSLAFQAEDARSLRAGEPWTVLEPDSFRSNPPISEGRITSAVLSLNADWELERTETELLVELEGATETLGGDYAFARFLIDIEFAMRAFADHTLEVEGHFQGVLPGTDSLPRQRWTFVGGSGTLYTFEIGEFPGDRVAFVESEYSIPFPRSLHTPIGLPVFDILHNVGMAWSHDQSRDFEQNVGIQLRFPLVFARFVVDPANTDRNEFSLGLRFPDRRPWEP